MRLSSSACTIARCFLSSSCNSSIMARAMPSIGFRTGLATTAIARNIINDRKPIDKWKDLFKFCSTKQFYKKHNRFYYIESVLTEYTYMYINNIEAATLKHPVMVSWVLCPEPCSGSCATFTDLTWAEEAESAVKATLGRRTKSSGARYGAGSGAKSGTESGPDGTAGTGWDSCWTLTWTAWKCSWGVTSYNIMSAVGTLFFNFIVHVVDCIYRSNNPSKTLIAWNRRVPLFIRMYIEVLTMLTLSSSLRKLGRCEMM